MYKLYKSKFLNDLFSFAEKKNNPIISMRLERNIQKQIHLLQIQQAQVIQLFSFLINEETIMYRSVIIKYDCFNI